MNSLLPDALWRHRPGLERLIDALGGATGETRYVGGAVRDTVLGGEVSDVDMATLHPPTTVIDRLTRAGIKAVPTGLAHGTITAVVNSRPYEITTLRSDVDTDGRHATVAFTGEWRADAARRDFTINALYAHMVTGHIDDYFGGLSDLSHRIVRFIGEPEARIAEDHLRILRYFRFFARFGGEAPDPHAYGACCALANSMMALSRERIADELLKLLALPRPMQAIDLMVSGGIFVPMVPEIDAAGARRLDTLIAREDEAGLPGDALRRLCALLPPDAQTGDKIAARLKLSNKARKRIALALEPPPVARSPHELAYRLGAQGAQDVILLSRDHDPRDAAMLLDWHEPVMCVSGAHLITLGLTPGPMVSGALKQVKEQWIAEAFPGPERTYEIAAQVVAATLRARQ